MMRAAIWLAAGLTLIAAPAQAETLVVDFDQAVARALARDARIDEKERLVDVARGLVREAKGSTGLIYDVNTFIGVAPKQRGGFFETEDAEGNQGIGIPADAFSIDGLSPWYYLEFQVIKPLLTFGKAENYTAAARHNVAVKQGDVALARGQTALDVGRAYFGYLAARDTRLLLEDAQGRIQGAEALVQQWLDEDEGKAKRSELFALQTGAAILRRYLAEARGYETIAMAGLRMLLGVSPADELQLADKHLQPADLPALALPALQDQALNRRPEMQQLRAGLEARRALVEAKRSERYPNVYTGVAGLISYSPGHKESAEVSGYDPFFSGGVTPVLGLKWDWLSGRQAAQVAQAESELQATLALQAFAENGIPFQVAELYHQVRAGNEMVREMYEASRAGRRWMIASYADFEAGVEEAAKVMTAFQGYVLAYSDYVKAVNEYNLNVTRLRVATGEMQ